MAASLLLRRGRSAALKTVLREARLCRGLASTVSLSAESGKTEKGLPPDSKRQSPPKTSTKEKTRSQQGQPDPSPPERPRQAKKKGTPVRPLEDRKDTKPRTTAPGLHADKELMKQNVKEKQMGKILRSSEKDKESPKPLEVKKASPDHVKSGLSTQPAVSPAPATSGLSAQPAASSTPVTSGLSTQPAASSTPVTSGLSTQPAASPVPSSEASRAGGQLQAPPETRDGRLEKQVLERDGEGAFPPVGREGSGERIMGGVLQAREEALGDQVPPVQHQPGKPAGLELEGKDETASAPGPAERGDTQEPAQAASPAEPFDNTTYRNLQHHDYTPYTFLDLNLDLSKFRIPQPSSGRESPRH
ncbi:NADH dehydrogenase [ubiquinone] flavoprotein 3, mitochondrial isoform X3 [Mustela nigripes]|uniref:NADH dehydrogenase [ubiquinone] flavoprotein 3, mitochondrial isoform X3 n=1 Tax=Mustela nigripes TaxID=77151 RepID=UPI002814AA9A|nr:NADH dehydrogenase [ubiquinone] flavoprotein 3, mitochondrial isoform X3 [Mustela nigripes]